MFKGTIVALATPFTEHDQVDFRTLCELIEWHIDSGTDAIVLCGTTGEAPTLSDTEQIAIFKKAFAVGLKGYCHSVAGTIIFC